MSELHEGGHEGRRNGLVLAAVTVTSFLTAFAASSVNIALQQIGVELGMGGVWLNWVVTAFVLASAMFLLPMGTIGDLYGRKLIYVVGLALYSLGSVAAAAAWRGEVLIGSRVLTGVGGAMIFGTSTAILVASYPPKERGRILGITVAAVYAGISAGPFVAGMVVHFLNWRWLFGLHATIGFLSLLPVVLAIPSDAKNRTPGRFDLQGAVLYALSLAVMLAGLSFIPSVAGIAVFALGAAGIVVFFLYERSKINPVFRVDMFLKNRVFAFSNVAALVNYAATFAVSFYLSLYLQLVRGFSAQDAGAFMLVQPLVQTLFSPLTGRLSDRLVPGKLASAGMAFCTIGVLFFAFVGADAPLGLIVAAQVFLGLGFALFSSPNTNAVMGSVPRDQLGTASAMIATMRVLGQMLSMALALALFSVYVGPKALTPSSSHEFLMAMHTGFVVASVLCALGVFASLARGKDSAPQR